MSFKCETCGTVMYPMKVYTSHGEHVVYNCPNGCGGNTKKIMTLRKSGRTHAEKLQEKLRKLLYDTSKQTVRKDE